VITGGPAILVQPMAWGMFNAAKVMPAMTSPGTRDRWMGKIR